MDMKEIDRGFEGVLISCSNDTEPLLFDCPPQCFSNGDGTFVIYEIQNGSFSITQSDTPIDPPSIQFQDIIEIDDRSISGGSKIEIDEDIKSKLLFLNDHIAELAAHYFNTIVIRVKLIFGIQQQSGKSTKLILLDGSTVITSDSRANSDLLRPNNEEGSDINASNYYDEESELLDAIDIEINRPIDRSRCVSNGRDCGVPKYRVKRIIVSLYYLHIMFPHFDNTELYYQIKLRMRHINEEVSCCVSCYHLFMATERVCRASKKSGPLSFELRPQPFQPLVESEMQKRGKKPIDSTTKMKNEAHSYVLNIVNSPYKGSIFNLKAPPKVTNNKKRGIETNRSSSRQSMPKWVNRMTGDDVDQSYIRGFGARCSTSAIRYRRANPNDLPYFPTPIGFAEALAPQLYYPPPLDISLLDPKKKRMLHRNNV